jgi:two-component system nitrate/nitrite response regulator NarL
VPPIQVARGLTTCPASASTLVIVTTFVILEDHELVREGIRMMLVRDFPEAEILYSGQDLHAAVNAVISCTCDCAIVDLDLGDGTSPVEVVSTFVRRDVPVLVVSSLGSPGVIRSALTAGASAYVTKNSPNDELAFVIRHVLKGYAWVTSDLADVMSRDSLEIQLSEQEQAALTLYASGLTLESVARHMSISPNTAKSYLDRIRSKYEKSGIRARTKVELSNAARMSGLL